MDYYFLHWLKTVAIAELFIELIKVSELILISMISESKYFNLVKEIKVKINEKYFYIFFKMSMFRRRLFLLLSIKFLV